MSDWQHKLKELSHNIWSIDYRGVHREDLPLAMALIHYPHLEELSKNIAEGVGEEVDVLLNILEVGLERYDRVRAAAALVLGAMGECKHADALMNTLTNSGGAAVVTAAHSLGRLKVRKAVEPLVAILDKGSPEPDNYAAAYALCEIGDPRAIVPLMRALKRGDPYLQWAGAFALVKLGIAEAAEFFINSLKSDSSALGMEALEILGQPVVPRLIIALSHENSDVHDRAERVLTNIGGLTVPLLVSSLSHKSDRIREGAAVVLGNIGDAVAVKPLKDSIKREQVSMVRKAQTRSLKKILIKNRPFLDAYPNVYCRCGYSTVKKKVERVGIFRKDFYVLCERCGSSLILRIKGGVTSEIVSSV